MAMPEDVKKNIISLGKRLKKDPKELAVEMKEIISTDELTQTIENPEHKIRYAWGILFSRYARGAVTDVYFRPFLKPRIRKLKDGKSVCDVYGIICRIQETDGGKEEIGDAELVAGTLWEKSADAAAELKANILYRTGLKISETMGGCRVSGDNIVFKEVKAKVPTMEEFYKENIEPEKDSKLIGLGEMDLNIKTYDLDFRLFNVTIANARKGTDSNNNEYGVYDISDTTLLSDSDKPIAISLWLHPDDVFYGVGSVVTLMATIEANRKKEGEFIINPMAILPTSASYKMEIKIAGKKESVDIDELDDTEEKTTSNEIEDEFGL